MCIVCIWGIVCIWCIVCIVCIWGIVSIWGIVCIVCIWGIVCIGGIGGRWDSVLTFSVLLDRVRRPSTASSRTGFLENNRSMPSLPPVMKSPPLLGTESTHQAQAEWGMDCRSSVSDQIMTDPSSPHDTVSIPVDTSSAQQLRKEDGVPSSCR